MRCLHFIETFDPAGGGIPRVALSIRAHFPDDVVLAAGKSSLSATLGSMLNLRRSRVKFDAVFLHNIYSMKAMLLAIAAKAAFRTILIVTPHGASNIQHVRHSVKKSVYLSVVFAIIKPLIDRMHYLNRDEFDDSYLKRMYSAKVICFHYPILLDTTGVKIREKWNPSRELKVVFYSRVEKRKGIYVLLEAIADLSHSGIKTELYIYGPVEEQRFFHEISGRSDVHYMGQALLAEYVAKSAAYDVFCLPSFGEAHSLALFENLFLGLPCIVSRETNAPDCQGIVVYGPAHDKGKLAAAIADFRDADALEIASRENVAFAANYNARAKRQIDITLKQIQYPPAGRIDGA